MTEKSLQLFSGASHVATAGAGGNSEGFACIAGRRDDALSATGDECVPAVTLVARP